MKKLAILFFAAFLILLSVTGISQEKTLQVNYREYYTPTGEQYRTLFAWNSKTGKVARYYYDAEAWHKSTIPFPENPVGETTGEAGEIMMNYVEYYTPDGEQYRTVFVWNTKTGKVARYYFDAEAWHKSTIEFPDKPVGDLSGKTGEVMMSYVEYYTPTGEQYRTVWVWNTRTGNTARYYFDQEAWHKSTISFPQNPLGSATSSVGEVMMNYREYYTPSGEQYRSVFLWNTKTGKAARYYFDEEAWHKSTIDFPENPSGSSSGDVGEIMMTYVEYYTPEGEQFRTVFTWNTKNGQSARYYFDEEAWHKSTIAFPVNPTGSTLSGAGEEMMSYIEYYTPAGEQYRTVFTWNTKTQKAARYYFDEEAWHKSTIAFPENPVE